MGASSASIYWTADLSGIQPLLRTAAAARYQAALRIARQLAPEIRDWMRQNVQWPDDGGAARSSLDCVVTEERPGEAFVITLQGGGKTAPYARLFELNAAGKHAIILPAMEHWLPIFRDMVAAAVGGMA